MPGGEWVCQDAVTLPEPDRIGMADAGLFDERGPIGRAGQTLLIEAGSWEDTPSRPDQLLTRPDPVPDCPAVPVLFPVQATGRAMTGALRRRLADDALNWAIFGSNWVPAHSAAR